MKMCVPLTLSGSLSPDLLTKPLFGSQGPCLARNVVPAFQHSNQLWVELNFLLDDFTWCSKSKTAPMNSVQPLSE